MPIQVDVGNQPMGQWQHVVLSPKTTATPCRVDTTTTPGLSKAWVMQKLKEGQHFDDM